MDGGCWFENVSSLPFYVVNSVGSSTDIYVDFQLGNLHGLVEGMNASAEALLIGSHLVMIFFPIF